MFTEDRGLPEDAIGLGYGTFYTKVFRGGEWVGVHEWHRCRGDNEGEYSAGFIPFTGRTRPEWWSGTSPTWEVPSEEPLTLSPSLACQMCSHHGYIQQGRWVPC